MRTRTTVLLVVIAAVAVSLLAILAHPRTADAQYPPPAGTVSLSAGTTTPALGATVPIAATVRDQYGSAVAGLSCTFSIISQPGTDATVNPGPAMTDANGIANTTLTVGSKPGTIVVGAVCGELSSQVSVVAGQAAALPPTGTGPSGATLPPVWPVAGAMAAAGAALMLAGARYGVRRRR